MPLKLHCRLLSLVTFLSFINLQCYRRVPAGPNKHAYQITTGLGIRISLYWYVRLPKSVLNASTLCISTPVTIVNKAPIRILHTIIVFLVL